MQLDRAFLAHHSSFLHGEIEVRALHMEVGADRSFGLLYRPPDARGLGFVVCHSYGLEFLTLHRSERALALTLAGLGYPVLTFHHRGFGDSTGSLAEATLDRLRDEVHAAADWLSSETGSTRLGLVGGRLGGLVAGLVAQEGVVDRLVLMNPVLKGRAYARDLIKEMNMVRIATSDGDPGPSADDIFLALQADGMVDVLGYPFFRQLFDSLADVDLTVDRGAFRGDALVLQVSRRAAVNPELEAFRDRILAQGGRCRVELIKQPPRARFGGTAFVNTGDPLTREDVQWPIVEQISSLAGRWMSE